jgi:hypothetical protein
MEMTDSPSKRKNADVNERRRALFIAMIASVLLYFMWNMAFFAPVMAPLRLFVTYVHEAGHSLAALITGGRVIGFLVSPDGSGLATTAGGNRAVVISGGYLGAAIFGSGLFFLVNRYSRFDRIISFVLGAGMIVFTLLYARPDERGFPVAIFVGLAFGAALLLMGWRAPRFVTLLVLDMLAISTALNAVLDVWYLTNAIDASRGMINNDAVSYSREITSGLVPASLIALTWTFSAAVMFGMAVWYGAWRPLQTELNATLDSWTRR